MRIAVFGAAGRTGRLAVSKALGHGHDVVAFLHHSDLSLDHPKLTKVFGDVRDLATVRGAMAGADGVVFALSSAAGSRTHVHEVGVANVVYAMAENAVPRLAVMSAAGTFARSSSLLSPGFRLLIATTLRKTYDDLEAMERRVMATDLAWTIVRPYGLNDAGPTGRYRISLDGSLLPKAARIGRADAAALLIKALETDTYYRRAVVVAT
jgi:putative NADH-flavin reductase